MDCKYSFKKETTDFYLSHQTKHNFDAGLIQIT